MTQSSTRRRARWRTRNPKTRPAPPAESEGHEGSELEDAFGLPPLPKDDDADEEHHGRAARWVARRYALPLNVAGIVAREAGLGGADG